MRLFAYWKTRNRLLKFTRIRYIIINIILLEARRSKIKILSLLSYNTVDEREIWWSDGQVNELEHELDKEDDCQIIWLRQSELTFKIVNYGCTIVAF